MQRVVTKFVTLIVCVIVLLLTFSGCGKEQDSNISATSTSVTQQETTQKVAESSANDSGDVEVDFSDLQ